VLIFFSNRRNWDSPNPSPAGEFAPPPPFLGGGAHSLAREGLGESQFRRGDIHCGSVADPKQKFRIRIRSEVSFGFGSQSWIRIYRYIRNRPKLLFFLKFLLSLIFKHKKAALPQLRDLATNKVRNKFAGFGTRSISKRHGSADPDP
jgi:hypothetical protein